MFNLSLKTRFPSDISRITSTTTRTQGKKTQFQNALHTVALFTRFAQPTCSLRDARPACPIHAFQILLLYIYLPCSSQQCLKKKKKQRTGQIWKFCDMKLSTFSLNFQTVYTYLIPAQCTWRTIQIRQNKYENSNLKFELIFP